MDRSRKLLEYGNDKLQQTSRVAGGEGNENSNS